MFGRWLKEVWNHKFLKQEVPIVAQWKQIQLVFIRMQVWPLASLSGLKIQRCHKPWCRSQTWLGLHPVLLWLWLWLVTAAPIQPLAWELPYAVVGPKKKKKNFFQKMFSWNNFMIFFFFWPHLWHETFPGQGSNPNHSSDNAKSLTARPPGNSWF